MEPFGPQWAVDCFIRGINKSVSEAWAVAAPNARLNSPWPSERVGSRLGLFPLNHSPYNIPKKTNFPCGNGKRNCLSYWPQINNDSNMEKSSSEFPPFPLLPGHIFSPHKNVALRLTMKGEPASPLKSQRREPVLQSFRGIVEAYSIFIHHKLRGPQCKSGSIKSHRQPSLTSVTYGRALHCSIGIS